MNANIEYIKEFEEAAIRTIRENYSLPDSLRSMGEYPPCYRAEIYEIVTGLFMEQFAENDSIINYKNIKGQCIMLHYEMFDTIKKLVGVDPIITIGYVTYHGQDYFRFKKLDKSIITRVNGENQSEVNLHVWLTLPSYEIIDFSILGGMLYFFSVEEEKKILEKVKGFSFNFGDANLLSSKDNWVYHPLYIGKDTLIKNGFVSMPQ